MVIKTFYSSANVLTSVSAACGQYPESISARLFG